MKEEKKERQAQFHRELIIDAAEKLFIANGFEKTLMDEIAKVAGYSKSTVYIYFNSKDEIFNHIIFRGMNTLKGQLEKALQLSKEFTNQYYDLCYALSSFQEHYPLHFDSIVGNISIEFDKTNENDILYKIYSIGEEINSVVGKFLVKGIKASIINKALKLPETIFVFWASISGLIKIASQKAAYMQKQMHTSKEDFLHYGFTMLFNSIRGE